MLNLIRKEKVILRGLGRKGEERGGREGGRGTTAAAAKKGSRQGWSITVQCRKGETKAQKHSTAAAALGEVRALFVRCCCF